MLTQPERNALAREIGMGPEVIPWLWRKYEAGEEYCTRCNMLYLVCGCLDTTLPCPLSDDPAACLWDGAFMRALYKADLYPQLLLGGNEACVITGTNERHLFDKTPTAALYAAWKETKQC